MEKGWKNLISSGRSASRRAKALNTTFRDDVDFSDSGFGDGLSQVNSYLTSLVVEPPSPLEFDGDSAISLAHYHSSRRTGSNAS